MPNSVLQAELANPARPPRTPFGLFRTYIVMRMKAIRSLREMTRLLDTENSADALDRHSENLQGFVFELACESA